MPPRDTDGHGRAEAVDKQSGEEDGAPLGDDIPHVYVGFASCDNQVKIQRGYGEEGSADAEDAHEVG